MNRGGSSSFLWPKRRRGSKISTHGQVLVRLRAIQLKHRWGGFPISKGDRWLGASHALVVQAAGGSNRGWLHRGSGLGKDPTVSWFDRLDVPRFSRLQLLGPPGAEPFSGGCGKGSARFPPAPINRTSSPFSHRTIVEMADMALITIRTIKSLLVGGDSATRSVRAGSAPGPKSCRTP